MSQFRILVDECVQFPIVNGLRMRLPEVYFVQVGDATVPIKSTDDSELLEYCEQEKMLFLTGDRKTMSGHVADHHRRGGHTYGVFMVGGGLTVAEVVEELAVICGASKPDEWIDQFLYLSLSTQRRH